MSTPPTIQSKKPVRPTQQPGALRNQASLEIQTRQAQFLLDGRTGARGIVGLLQFSRFAGDLWHAAQQDDPYADWTLLRIEEAIEKARAFIHEKNLAMGKSLNTLGSMKTGWRTTGRHRTELRHALWLHGGLPVERLRRTGPQRPDGATLRLGWPRPGGRTDPGGRQRGAAGSTSCRRFGGAPTSPETR